VRYGMRPLFPLPSPPPLGEGTCLHRQFLNEPLVILDDPKHSDVEQRFHALGQTSNGRMLHITFAIRTGKIRIISARDMHRKERTIYEQEA